MIPALPEPAGTVYVNYQGPWASLHRNAKEGEKIYTAAQLEQYARDYHAAHAELVAAKEREECAISCAVNAARWIDAGGGKWYAAHECAAAIRARSLSDLSPLKGIQGVGL